MSSISDIVMHQALNKICRNLIAVHYTVFVPQRCSGFGCCGPGLIPGLGRSTWQNQSLHNGDLNFYDSLVFLFLKIHCFPVVTSFQYLYRCTGNTLNNIISLFYIRYHLMFLISHDVAHKSSKIDIVITDITLDFFNAYCLNDTLNTCISAHLCV